MFEYEENSGSSRCISTVTLLALALIFSPALAIISGSSSYFPAILAAAFSSLCVLIVWLSRRKVREVKVK